MKLDDQMVCLLADPEVYHYYFYNQYFHTLQILEKMQAMGCDSNHLIPFRIILAENAGKYMIARGALGKVPEETLVHFWNYVNQQKEVIHDDITALQQYERYILQMGKQCQST